VNRNAQTVLGRSEQTSVIIFKYAFLEGGRIMSIGTILLVILILALLGIIPIWPHSRSWGYGPSGGVGLIVVILVILLLLGRI